VLAGNPAGARLRPPVAGDFLPQHPAFRARPFCPFGIQFRAGDATPGECGGHRRYVSDGAADRLVQGDGPDTDAAAGPCRPATRRRRRPMTGLCRPVLAAAAIAVTASFGIWAARAEQPKCRIPPDLLQVEVKLPHL